MPSALRVSHECAAGRSRVLGRLRSVRLQPDQENGARALAQGPAKAGHYVFEAHGTADAGHDVPSLRYHRGVNFPTARGRLIVSVVALTLCLCLPSPLAPVISAADETTHYELNVRVNRRRACWR